MQRLTLLFALLILPHASAMAATITASSPSLRDVQSAVASARDGDTVIVPAGTATWTSGLTLTKGITLLGASSVRWAITTATGASLGVNVNTFTGSQSLNVVSTSGFAPLGSLDVLTSTGLVTVNYTGKSGNAFTGCSCTGNGVIQSGNNVVGQRGCIDATIIQDNVSPRGKLLDVVSASGKTYRISGITFTSVATTASASALVKLTGNSHSVRLDHCHFFGYPWASCYIGPAGPIYGVIDHNVFEMSGGRGHPYCFSFANGVFTDGVGNAEWSKPTGFGTGDWLFIEDNYWMNLTAQGIGGPYATGTCGTDSYWGGSAVIRYNHIFDVHFQDHGTQGNVRGARKREMYNNHLYNSQAHDYGGSRSGPTVSHDNVFLGVAPNNTGISQAPYRQANSYLGAWGCPVLPNKWDVVDTSSGIYTNCANPTMPRWGPRGLWQPNGSEHPVNNTGTFNYSPTNGLYDTLTAGTGTRRVRNGSIIVANTNKNWSTNQWTYFTVLRLKDNRISVVISNTGNTLSTQGADGSPPVFAPGDELQIRRYLVLLDQPGRGQCADAVSGTQKIATVAAGSVGVDLATFTGSGVLNVKRTTGFANSGTLLLRLAGDNQALIDYTGKTSRSFTGCDARSNASGVLGLRNSVLGYYQGVVNATTGTPSWPHQALEPSYEWNDVYTPTGVHMKLYGTTGVVPPPGFPNSPICLENRDFYNDTPMPGYKPYTYPHPLVSGGARPASAPQKTQRTRDSRGPKGFGNRGVMEDLASKTVDH
jgi:hypothetical protein